MPEKYFKLLPIKRLIKFTFDNKMKYWGGLALEWAERGAYGAELYKWAKGIDSSWMPQKLKHKFWKIMGVRSYVYLPSPNDESE